MDAIVSLLETIGNFIALLVDFVVDTITNLVYVIGLLGQFVLEIPAYFSWLPAEALVVLVTTFSLVVIYMILNRK